MSKGSEWADRQKKAIIAKLESTNVVYLAATGTMIDMSKRIWGRGELTNGGKLKYKDDYELWAYKPPSPKKVTGKGKPYEDWIVRPESVSENRAKTNKSVKNAIKNLASAKKKLANATTQKQRDKYSKAVSYWEVRGEVSSQKKDKFSSNFGKDARKIKGGYYKNYTAYKEQQGRADTPFELTGDLRQAWFGGATPTPRKIGPQLCTITLPEKQSKIAEGLTDTKGAFLVLNEKEREGYIKRCKELWSR